MRDSSNGRRLAPPHIVHVARECAELAVAGGVGDVVLQLALQCLREGLPTTIFLPHYGGFSREGQEATAERLARLLPWTPAEVRYRTPLALEVPMAYVGEAGRVEAARIETIEFRGRAKLVLARVVADRFVGKRQPYVYTAAEAQAIRSAPPDAESVCGAEVPPKGFPVEEGSGHFDYFAMNVLLQKTAIAWVERLRNRRLVVHCHDAHAALLPMLVKEDPRFAAKGEVRFVVTAHNCGIAYRQRCADLDFVATVTGMPQRAVRDCVVEGEFDPFGAAAIYADHFTTVSDGYAWEVQSAWRATSGGDPELRGFSEFLLRKAVRIRGIVNGVSAAIKGPEAHRGEFGGADQENGSFAWKSAYRSRFIERIASRDLPAEWGIRPANRHGHLGALPAGSCLFSFVGRWTGQKGLDIAVRAAQEVLRLRPEAGFCVLGDGNQPFLLPVLLELVDEFPGRVVVVKGFSERLASCVYAAGDFFLVPSRFEPCGLIDLIAQLNGNIPIVNQVGGLSKVVDGVTGIGYFATNDRDNLRGLVHSMRRAIDLFAEPRRLARMQRDANRAVRTNYTWKAVFSRYAALYGVGEAGRAARISQAVPLAA